MEQISTDGEPGPAYYHLGATPGMHRVEAETLDRSPVRLFGWVAENTTGVTYEELGINGAEASIILGWNEETLRSNIERRNPALIVLAYGTNEAGRKDWTLESYREMYSNLIARLAGGCSYGGDSRNWPGGPHAEDPQSGHGRRWKRST